MIILRFIVFKTKNIRRTKYRFSDVFNIILPRFPDKRFYEVYLSILENVYDMLRFIMGKTLKGFTIST